MTDLPALAREWLVKVNHGIVDGEIAFSLTALLERVRDRQMKGYKVTTHDLRPPVRGGDPIWDGTTPFALPRVECDTGTEECGAGWNFTLAPETALRIGGFWPTGRPSRLWHVEANGEAIQRGDKCRSPELTIVREATEAEVNQAIASFSKVFGAHSNDMEREQILWREALARPLWDEGEVERGLEIALRARGLDWKLKRYDSALAAWDARAAWAALVVQYAARQKWINHPPDMLTAGIRDAYRNGLAVALPTGPNELGWAMEAKP